MCEEREKMEESEKEEQSEGEDKNLMSKSTIEITRAVQC
jgi:hypothetical protein